MKQYRTLLSIVFLILAITICGCIDEDKNNINNGQPETLTLSVGNHTGADFTKIQDAIDAAQAGATIQISSGLYQETLLINKAITLQGENPENTILDFYTYTHEARGVITIEEDNCSIQGLTILNSDELSDITALYVNSSNNSIVHLIIQNISDGIYLAEGTMSNIVSDNTISFNEQGIILDKSTHNHIQNNTVTHCSQYGIHIYNRSDENILSGNNITDSDMGIRIRGSVVNTVYANTIADNKQGFLFCCGAAENTVYHNIFQNNSNYNARDFLQNHWDNGTVGNYWDDYNGTDANNDGIGDTSYAVAGANNKDHFPLMNKP